jgi:hypothetical protein
LLCGFAIAPASAAAERGPVSVTVAETPVGAVMSPGFLGFSFETWALPAYAGHNAAAINPTLLALIRTLNPAGSPVLRIGGDSTDETWWPVRGMTKPAGVRYTLTPNWLRIAHAVASDLDARMVFGVNLAANSIEIAATEAQQILHGVGLQFIEAFEIGNEPDLYTAVPLVAPRDGAKVFARPSGYSEQEYFAEFARWRAALPLVPIAGPALATVAWLSELNTFLAVERPISLVTFHRYPLLACEHNPAAVDYPSIPHLLTNLSSAGLAKSVAPYVTIAHAAGVQFRLDELNSVACRGKAGVSNTFASSLWVLDTLFNLASVGVDGVNIHTLPDSAYQPFTFKHVGGIWYADVHPLYYGLLAFSQAFPAGARLLNVSAPEGPLKVWATQTPHGATQVVLINKSPSHAYLVQLTLPAGIGPLTGEALTAPKLASTTGVELGGETFGPWSASGLLPSNPAPPLILGSPSGAYSVRVPARSALLLSGSSDTGLVHLPVKLPGELP